jgi:hypothetical protein
MDTIGDIMLSEVRHAQKDRGHVFSHMWKIHPKDKQIHKNKHDHIQTPMYNLLVIVEHSMELRERGKEKGND